MYSYGWFRMAFITDYYPKGESDLPPKNGTGLILSISVQINQLGVGYELGSRDFVKMLAKVTI